MKKQNLLPIIGVILVVLCAIGTMINKAGSKPVAPSSVIPPETSSYSVDQLHLITKKVLDKTMPEHYTISIDKDTHTCTINYWIDGFNADIINEAFTRVTILNKWNENLKVYGGYCDTVKNQFDDSGHSEYDVILNFVNCDNFAQTFATWKNGEVIYDIVEATPPGERVE